MINVTDRFESRITYEDPVTANIPGGAKDDGERDEVLCADAARRGIHCEGGDERG